ncbi:hypothetical protein [Teredinibacter purpureus]|uniref:hypothetical protein n=1 Tax=Teredinibacter purpureus TaxID=2731756 RepID=UPI0005F896D9|nr:hypothetical protein [Teredinibacter purpureus]
MSSATEYTKKIIEAFSQYLPIQWENERPFIVEEQVTKSGVISLRKAIHDLHSSDLKDKAILDLEEYGRSKSIQTSGVGLAEDFNTFVNLGLLIGERVVLWDTVLLGALFPNDGELSVSYLCSIAIEYALLGPAIENEHIVILPHPGTWLDRCRHYYQAVYEIEDVSPAFSGYLHSRALLDEGFNLHPYTLNFTSEINGNKYDVKSAINLLDKQGARNDKKEISADDLIMDVEFGYLKDIETRQLSNFVKSHTAWKRALDNLLKVPDYISTEADLSDYISGIKETVQKGIHAENHDLRSNSHNMKKEGVGLTGGLMSVTSSVALAVSSPTIASSLNASAVAVGVFGVGLSAYSAYLALSKVVEKPKEDVVTLYQGFTIVRDMDEANKKLKRMQQAAPFS